ncbi:hypothetical protein Tco_0331111 [Tanacetum coccineum]
MTAMVTETRSRIAPGGMIGNTGKKSKQSYGSAKEPKRGEDSHTVKDKICLLMKQRKKGVTLNAEDRSILAQCGILQPPYGSTSGNGLQQTSSNSTIEIHMNQTGKGLQCCIAFHGQSDHHTSGRQSSCE